MATRLVSMRFLCTIFQPVLTLRCHGVNIKRYVRRRRSVSGLISVNQSIENLKRVVSQNEHLLQDNIFRNPRKDSIQPPGNTSDSVQFPQLPRCDDHQPTKSSRFGEVDGLLYEKAQPGDKSLMWVKYWHVLLRDSCPRLQRTTTVLFLLFLSFLSYSFFVVAKANLKIKLNMHEMSMKTKVLIL